MKRSLVLVISLGVFWPLMSQKPKSYIVTRDSLKFIQGEIATNTIGRNSFYFRQNKYESFKEFHANYIAEFGTENGHIYKGERVDNQYIFLVSLWQGNPELLSSQNRQVFYLKNDSIVNILDKRTFRTTLRDYLSERDQVGKVLSKTRYKEASLVRAFQYNAESSLSYNQIRIGALVGYTIRKPTIVNEFANDANLQASGGLMAGLFVIVPIHIISPHSISFETSYSESSHTLFRTNVGNTVSENYLVKVQSINFPIIFNYRLTNKDNWNAYLNLGAQVRMNISDFDNKRIIFLNSNQVQEMNLNMPDSEFSALTGFSLEYLLNDKRYLMVAFRYEKSSNFGKSDVRWGMNSSLMHLVTLINF